MVDFKTASAKLELLRSRQTGKTESTAAFREIAPRIVPTEDQARAIEAIVRWAGDPDGPPTMVLMGHAGTGKSTIVQEVVRAVGAGRCVLTAPTNKAALVLKRMAARAGISVPCLTAHSAHGLRLEDDDEEKYTVKANEGRLEGVELVVADEASMLDERLHSEFVDVAMGGRKVLFVGDPLQLPPVRSDRSPAFDDPNRVELTKIVRQAEGNPIVRVGEWLRKLIVGEPAGPMPVDGSGDGPGVRTMRRGDFLDRMIAELGVRATTGREGTARGIAFRNAQVDELAASVRRTIHGQGVGAFVPGERVFAIEPWGPLKIDFEATVKEVGRSCPHPRHGRWNVVPIVVVPEHLTKDVHAYAIAPSDRGRWEAHVDAERDKIVRAQKAHGRTDDVRRMWRDWHAFKGSFASLRSVHAITAHRSQGSTFDEVFVDVPDMQGAARHGGEAYKYRLLYVAITRASERAWLSW